MADNEIDVYKTYFDLWIRTRDERTAYNKYFLTLLFIDTLVGVFTAVLGAAQATAFPDLTRTLLLVMLLTAVGISLVWFCKLFALNVVEDAQKDVLKLMEERLQIQEFPEVEATFSTNIKTGVLGMELFLERQDANAHSNLFFSFLWWANLWLLPLLFIAAFAALSFYLYSNPSAIPLPNVP
jgi:hypothetical protein